MSKTYWVYQKSSPEAIEEAFNRAVEEGYTPKQDRIGVTLVGKWDIFGLKPYLIALAV